MYNLNQPTQPNSPELIVLHLNDVDALKGLHQSNAADYSPEDLTISFSRVFIDQAKQNFNNDPDIFYIAYYAEISSERFDGKIDGDYLRFYNPEEDNWISISFYNSCSGTFYELDITKHVNDYLSNHPKL